MNYVQGPLLLFLFYCPALDDYNIAEMGCLWVVYTTVPMLVPLFEALICSSLLCLVYCFPAYGTCTTWVSVVIKYVDDYSAY